MAHSAKGLKRHFTRWTALVTMLCCALLASPAFGQFQFQRLKSFGIPDVGGHSPNAGLLEGSDGKLYGTTSQGGSDRLGTVFSVNANGSGYSVLHAFNLDEGKASGAMLIEASDGSLYGTTLSRTSDGVSHTIDGSGAVFE